MSPRRGTPRATSKAKADKISRPVLFGEAGRSLVSYEVDGFHPEHGVVLEVEAGRGAANNADYRDLMIRSGLETVHLVTAPFVGTSWGWCVGPGRPLRAAGAP